MKTAQAQYIQGRGWSKFPSENEWNSKQTLILIFSSPHFFGNPELFSEIQKRYPLSTMAGCSTSGEIQGSELFDSSVSVTFLKFENSKFKHITVGLKDSLESVEKGKFLAKSLLDKELKGILIFSDGLLVNGSKLIEGFKSIINTSKIPLGGGLAGDGNNFRQTFIVSDGQIKTGQVIAIGFYGEEVEISVSYRGGWDIFGPSRTVTKSKGNELFELDGKPALDLYKEYLGPRAKDLPASGLLFPLEISPPSQADEKLVRTILSINESNKSLIFAGDIPMNWTAQLMRANFERIIDEAGQAYRFTDEKLKKSNSERLVLAVSCVGRRLILGERTSEEIESIAEQMDSKSKLTGFYSYGEIAPTVSGNSCELHNQSMTLFVIQECDASYMNKVG